MGDLAENEIGRSSPAKGLRLAVVGGNIVHDRLAQMRDGAEAAAANRFRRNLGKPAFDLIEPRAVGRDEVQVKPWVARWGAVGSSRSSPPTAPREDGIIFEPGPTRPSAQSGLP